MAIITIEVAHNIGDIVFLITDQEQLERMVIALTVYKDHVLYELSQGTNFSTHTSEEIATEKDIVKMTSN